MRFLDTLGKFIKIDLTTLLPCRNLDTSSSYIEGLPQTDFLELPSLITGAFLF